MILLSAPALDTAIQAQESVQNVLHITSRYIIPVVVIVVILKLFTWLFTDENSWFQKELSSAVRDSPIFGFLDILDDLDNNTDYAIERVKQEIQLLEDIKIQKNLKNGRPSMPKENLDEYITKKTITAYNKNKQCSEHVPVSLHCPSCGAPLKPNQTECAYCDTSIMWTSKEA